VSQIADPVALGSRLAARLSALRNAPHRSRGFVAHGVLRRMAGMTLEATGCEAPVGSRCLVVDTDGSTAETEVVGFSGESLLLVATDELA
jgi:flagellum-specific ATP synthase